MTVNLSEQAQALRTDYDAVSLRMSELFYEGFTDKEINVLEAMLIRILANLRNTEQANKPEKPKE
ncbi:MAG: hypothetical protein LLG44_08440 [Chloroflexi bacterium]|nr:hypothetical protein [Chloroflexota bacterium]